VTSAQPEPSITIRRSDDPRVIAREGLIGLGYSAQEAEELLGGLSGSEPEELLAAALRSARR
jgi:Holliday junction DNA helicase RuvA